MEAAPFGAASTASSASPLAYAAPCRFRARFARAAVSIGRAYRSMSSSLLVRTWCRISSSGDLGPLLVPCSLCFPASEILSFFLRIFRGGSSGVSPSHCWSLLNWRHLSVFRPASAGGRYTLWPSGWRLRSSASADRSRPGMGGRPSSPPSGEAGCGTSCTLDALCIGRNFFPVNPGSSRLSLVWWFSGLVQVFSCLALSVLSEASPTFHRLISPRYGCV